MTEEIIRRCKDGDRDAFRELLRIYSPVIQRIAGRMTRNPDWRKDIFQIVVETLLKKINHFKGESTFNTWLYRITVNTSLRYITREKRHQHEEVTESIAGFGDTERGFMRKILLSDVMEKLARLPEGYRTVLSLFYFAEMSIDEISLKTGKSKSAVKTMLFKARQRLIYKLQRGS